MTANARSRRLSRYYTFCLSLWLGLLLVTARLPSFQFSGNMGERRCRMSFFFSFLHRRVLSTLYASPTRPRVQHVCIQTNHTDSAARLKYVL